MHVHYKDILDRIKEEPEWWDENAVPRYGKFEPKLVDIYAKEVVLLLIRCQNCGYRFKVCLSHSDGGFGENIKDLEFGDPPNIRCCIAGPSMSSEPIKILESWIRQEYEWVRFPELEISLDEEY